MALNLNSEVKRKHNSFVYLLGGEFPYEKVLDARRKN